MLSCDFLIRYGAMRRAKFEVCAHKQQRGGTGTCSSVVALTIRYQDFPISTTLIARNDISVQTPEGNQRDLMLEARSLCLIPNSYLLMISVPLSLR